MNSQALRGNPSGRRGGRPDMNGHDTHVSVEEVVEGRRNCSFATAGELSHCSIRNCFSPFVDAENDRQQANQREEMDHWSAWPTPSPVRL